MIYSPNKYRETEGIKDSFSINHTVPYAAISLQEMNLWRFYPEVFWNTSCLSINAGADESVEENKSTAYGKVGIAVSNMQKEGITIANPDINEAQFSFDPDVENNAIIYALKAINGIGDDLCREIIKHRPYNSFDDFCEKMVDTKIIQPAKMLMLIKAGCFLNLDSLDRFETMRKYLMKYQYKPTDKLTLSQMKAIQEYKIVPQELQICVRYLNFKKYVLDDAGFISNFKDPDKKVPKCGYHDRYYILDKNSQPFFEEHFSEDSIVRVQDTYYVISEKKFSKEIDDKLQPLKEWFTADNTLEAYNKAAFNAIWDQYASGTEARWSMQALTYYDQKHELEGIDESQYGIVNFYDLPEEPEAYETYTRWINGELKEMKKFRIDRLGGCVLNADNGHHVVSILTTNGVVDCKFSKEQYAFYTRQISKQNSDGSKTIIEKSWFQRGNLVLISGFRRGDQFVPRTYTDSVFKHSVCKIVGINPDNTLDIQTERTKVD